MVLKQYDSDFFDEDGYPLDGVLQAIRDWDMKNDFHNLMGFVQEVWHWGENQYSQKDIVDTLGRPCTEYELHTGGWSGNESIIDALQDNLIFWMMCWWMSRAGGHYWFRIRKEGKE